MSIVLVENFRDPDMLDLVTSRDNSGGTNTEIVWGCIPKEALIELGSSSQDLENSSELTIIVKGS